MTKTAHLITEIQSLGLKVGPNPLSRKGGAGPAEGLAAIIGGYPVSVPVASDFVKESPFELRHDQGQPTLYKHDQPVGPVEVVNRPRFYDLTTSDGQPFPRIALLHGRDCLATTVRQTCLYWPADQRCRFCGIELSLKSGGTIAMKTPDHIAEVARRARELDGVTHVVLTTGTAPIPGAELDHLAACASAIKAAAELPIHAQFSPPPELDRLKVLKDAGVDTVGTHIESFDPVVLNQVAPAKAALGLAAFERTWRKSVELFGPNQVSSFLLVGLGEEPESVVSGSRHLAEMGVYPFVVPLRPIPGSLVAKSRPPSPTIMIDIYEAVAEILAQNALTAQDSLAGCVRCGACSALPAYEGRPARTRVRPARTQAELDQALAIRRQVFVREQGIFDSTDVDENDGKSVHLIAEMDGRIVGTVRIFPDGEEGHWIGGRLAVEQGFRATGAGEALVRAAVRQVRRRRVSRFTAWIQEENVPFFLKLGWRPLRPVESHHGRPHQLMAADLE